MVLGVLHRVPNPVGYQMQASTETFAGTNIRVMEDKVGKQVDMYINMLLRSAEDFKEKRVDMEVKISVGIPIKKAKQQEVLTCHAAWLVLNRHLRRDLKFYVKQIPCKVAQILDDLTVKVVKPENTSDVDNTEHKLVLSMSKAVPLSALQDDEDIEQSVNSFKSYSASFSSLESFDVLKNDLMSSFMNRSRGHSSSTTDDHNSTLKQEKSDILRMFSLSHNDRVLLERDKILDREIGRASSRTNFEAVPNNIISRGDILHRGDTIMVLGVLHSVPNPSIGSNSSGRKNRETSSYKHVH